MISILGLLLSLFTSYVSYPGAVAVRFNEIGQAVQYVDREAVFYIAVAIFLINNTLISTVARLFTRVPIGQIPIPNQPLWADHRAELNEVITNWFYAIMSAINTILALALFVLSLLNRSDLTATPINYAWLLPLSTLILAAVLIALPVRLLIKPAAHGER
ncbi:hypothetical protein [Fibrisoma limi]|uniref:hypothetical protein n=1 Tax=Fibrisoma limi TaxID=663275 RepID=UPI001E32D2C3|nr:hypothetical protein [Fibrisoma limi]